MTNTFTLPFDFEILEYVQSNLRNPFCDWFFPTITHLGDAGIFWIILSLLLLIPKQTRKIGLCSAIALIADVLLCNLGLKLLVMRTRPYDMVEEYARHGLELLTSIQPDTSFPSGHAAASFASAFAILIGNKKIGIPAVIVAILIAFSRIYVAVHFPSDVFFSVILGVVCAIIAYFITKKVYPLLEAKLSRTKN